MPILPAPEPVVLQASPVIANQQIVSTPQVVVPCYAAQPIVYVVQVPGAGPTPPNSECSSDVENLQLCTVERLAQPIDVEQKDDIIILPLSPDPELQCSLDVTEDATGRIRSIVTSSNISLPDRRKKKNKKGKINNNNNNNNNDNSSEEMDCDVEVVQTTPATKTVSQSVILSETFFSIEKFVG